MSSGLTRLEILRDALEQHYAVPAVNFENFDVLEGIIMGADRAASPIIVQTTPPAIAYLGLENIVSVTGNLRQRYGVEAILQLDHGETVAAACSCVDAGYDAVMIDFSLDSFEDNVQMTREVLDYSRRLGVFVESEIGVIGAQESTNTNTEVEAAARFMEEVPVDILAISVGSFHGDRSKHRRLDLALLESIAGVAGVPLVLHGSSGVRNEDIREAIQLGVTKVNIETEIRQVFRRSLEGYLEENPDVIKPRQIMAQVREDVARAVAEKCVLFGSAGTR